MRRYRASPAGLRFWILGNPFPTWPSRCIRIISDLRREPPSMRSPMELFDSTVWLPAATEWKFIVRTISINGRDVIETGITVPERAAPIEISATLDFQPGRLFGKNVDSKDRPIPGGGLACMSGDRNKRRLDPYCNEMTSDR